MKPLITSALVGLLLSLPGADARAAEDASGDLDHLVCYKTKDPMNRSARFDLLARLQPEFSRAGCELVLDQDDEVNTQFCVPASKLNVEAPEHHPEIAGAPIADDYLCYRVECAAGRRPPNKILSDQFGERQVRFGQPARICVPATKEPVGCARTGTTSKGAAICGGVCPTTGNRCQLHRPSNSCVCATAACSGRSDSVGVCGGSCTDPADHCVVDQDNRCLCEPRGCGLEAANQCGGACPVDLACLPATGGGCECSTPASSGCSFDPDAGACGGECPEGLFCLPPSSGGDGCICRTFGGLG